MALANDVKFELNLTSSRSHKVSVRQSHVKKVHVEADGTRFQSGTVMSKNVHVEADRCGRRVKEFRKIEIPTDKIPNDHLCPIPSNVSV